MLRKIPFDTSAPILERFTPGEKAAAALSPDAEVAASLSTLAAGGHMVELVNFLAHGLPPREGVCWAIAVQRDLNPLMPQADAAVLGMAADWVRDPQESTRIALMEEGERRDSSDPVSWLCNAVAWNGSGSIGPRDGPVVLPQPGLHASALLGAVAMMAGDTEQSLAALVKSAHRLGLEVAEGGWPLDPV